MYHWKQKKFIRSLLNPNSSERPTATEALADPWLTTHEPSVEHDLSTGLREHFDPRARWRSAITSALAIHRLQSFASSKSSNTSQGWINDDSEDEEVGGNNDNHNNLPPPGPANAPSVFSPKLSEEDPGSNEFVNVIAPEEEEEEEEKLASVREQVGTYSVQEIPKPILPHTAAPPIVDKEDAAGPIYTTEPESMADAELKEPPLNNDDNDTDEPQMPGSFDLLSTTTTPHSTQKQSSWVEMLKKLYV